MIMETISKGRLIYNKAVSMLGAQIDATVIHKIETIADDFDYTDDDNEQAENHKKESEANGRQMLDPFLSRVANYNDPESEDNYPADPALEILRYLGAASHGVITPQWNELREFIDATMNPVKEEAPAKKVEKEKADRAFTVSNQAFFAKKAVKKSTSKKDDKTPPPAGDAIPPAGADQQ